MGLKILVNSLHRGGAEKQAARLAAELPHEAFLTLEAERGFDPSPVQPQALTSHDGSTPALLKTLFIPSYASRLAARTGRADTVLSFMERSNLANILAARKSGHRAVICERTRPSGEFEGPRGLVYKPLIRKLYPEAALIIANSAGVKKDLTVNFDIPAEKIKVVYNGFDLEAIKAAAAQPLPSGWNGIIGRRTLITSGRLTWAKGGWHLLRIFALLRKEDPAMKLVFLGEGELEKDLAALARRIGFDISLPGGPPDPKADVFFAGFQRNPFAFLSKAGLFMFTSLWEGFPNALVEAMACGLPVAAADCEAGPREILPAGGSAGLLMPELEGRSVFSSASATGGEKSWAVKLAPFLKDPARLAAAGTAAAARAAEFSLARSVEGYKAALELK